MPAPIDLPPSIADLTRRQAAPLTAHHFVADLDRLMKTIGRRPGGAPDG
jgi:hypothetical protein